VIVHDSEGMRQRRGFRPDGAEGEGREDQRKGKKHGRLVWNRFKWCIFFANLVVCPSFRGTINSD
jgi:hypothetical protein